MVTMVPRRIDEEKVWDPLEEEPGGKEENDDDHVLCGNNNSAPSTPPASSLHATTAALCFCMLTHSYLLISVFPYSGFLAMHLLDLDETEAAQYAGYLASSFMVGRACSSLALGRAADRYGRTTVLCTSLLLQFVFSLWFGFVRRSFLMALTIRFLLGFTNGIMQVIKTLVSEISSKEDEARNMTFVIGMWGWGFLVSPAVAGALAEPVRQYPDSVWIQESNFLQAFPFVLPNLLGAGLCLFAVLAIKLFVRETLPETERHSFVGDVRRWQRRVFGVRDQSVRVLKAHESDRDFSQDEEGDCEFVLQNGSRSKQKEVTSMVSLMSRPKTRKCLAIYWLYSFVGLTVDECFPLFCLSHTAGFGLSEKEIGKILSLCGMIFAICQYCVYNSVYNRFGLYGSIKIGSCLSGPVLLLIPLSLLLNRGMPIGELRWRTFVFLACMLAMYRCFSLVFFSSISVATNRTVPVSDRAAMNGLSVLGGSVAKGIGPTFAGILTTVSVKWLGHYASMAMFGIIGILGLGVTASSVLLLHDENEETSEAIDDDGQEQENIVQNIELTAKEQHNNEI